MHGAKHRAPHAGRMLVEAGLAVTALLLVVAAAKAHGRQVRLERELEGHHEVTFGGDNPPFVTALWRRDRVRFWTTAPAAGILLAVGLWWAQAPGATFLALLVVPPVAGFVVAGLSSLLRLQHAMGARRVDAAWRRAAMRGSAAWWSLVALLAAAAAALGARAWT